MMLYEKYAKELSDNSMPLLDSGEVLVVPVVVAKQKLQLLEAALKQKLADAITAEAAKAHFEYEVEFGENGVANVVGDAKEGSVVSLPHVLEILHSL